jgi:hypothetical protein
MEQVARATLPGVELVLVDGNRLLDATGVDGVVGDALELTPQVAAGELVVRRTLSEDRKAYWLHANDESLARDLDAWLLAHERDGSLAALRAQHLGPQAASVLAPATAWAVDVLGRRLMLMPSVGLAKRDVGLPIEDAGREAQVIERAPEAVRPLARAEIEAAKAVQDAGTSTDVLRAPLADLRLAIDRVDDSVAGAIAAAAPIADDADAMLAQLRRDAPVPGATDAVLRPLVDALRGLPPVQR